LKHPLARDNLEIARLGKVLQVIRDLNVVVNNFLKKEVKNEENYHSGRRRFL
jgi:hypothetical protein